MCGIAGIIDQSGDVDLSSVLSRMGGKLAHRGPDDQGIWCDPTGRVGLVHRRLAILDLSPEGHQPMISASGRYVIAFNGEIYNFERLRPTLEAGGATFRGHSDTEVFLAAVDLCGLTQALELTIGMFAVALVDTVERRLFLIRDRFGKKPLYYGLLRSGLVFASELKAFDADPRFEATIDRDSLAAYFRHNYVPAPHSIYRSVRKVMPGSVVAIEIDQKELDPKSFVYWSATKSFQRARTENARKREHDRALCDLDVLLRDAVALRMRSDVPLGAFLSGGIDSTLIVALMQAQASNPVRTFTVGFHESDFDEAAYARKVAQHLGTEHTELYVTPADTQAIVPLMPQIYDEPFADSSQIPTYLICRLARENVTVALSGDGGDEIFLGYQRYSAAVQAWRRIGWLPTALRARVAAVIRRAPAQTLDDWFGWANALLPAFGRQRRVSESLYKAAQILDVESRNDFYRAFVSHWKDPTTLVIGAGEVAGTLGKRSNWPADADFATTMGFMDAIGYLPDDILVKVDRASMAVSLEVRAPLLDHRIAEFAWSLPASWKVGKGRGKLPLRELLGRYVPKHLFERPKMGFGVPLKEWLRGPLREWVLDTLNESRVRRDGYLNPSVVATYVDEHLTGTRDWHARLWDLLMFCSWLDRRAA